MQSFEIPGRLPGQNDMTQANRSHRYAGSSQKKKWTTVVHLAALAAGIKPVGRCRIRYRWYEPNRRRDLDNIRSGSKFILDGLVVAGVLEDDGWRVITGLEDTFSVDKKNPRIIVEIIEEPK